MVFENDDATAVQTIAFPGPIAGGVVGLGGAVQDARRLPPELLPRERREGEDPARAFLVGPENRLVETVVKTILGFAQHALPAGDPPAAWLNPLAIIGPTGSGKSHLALGLASIVAAAAGPDQVFTVSAADFASQYSAAVADDSLHAMRARIRSARLLVVEDLGRLPRRRSVQSELLYRLDECLDSGAWLVVTADHVPSQLANLAAAIGSRLESGLVLPLAAPGPAVRREYLRQAAAVQGVQLGPQEISEIAQRLPATICQLSGVIQRAKLAQLAGTPENADDGTAERRSREGSAPHLPAEQIFAVTARYFGVSQTALRSASRSRSLVHARSVAMYLARELAGATLQDIGLWLGGRDHTTVLHACRKIDRAALHEVSLQKELADLRRLLLAT